MYNLSVDEIYQKKYGYFGIYYVIYVVLYVKIAAVLYGINHRKNTALY